MKTPKRIAYCGCGCALYLESATIEVDGKDKNMAALFCPKCGAEYPGEAFAARCIRKNREARLRHALARRTMLARELKWGVNYWCSRTLDVADVADKFRYVADSSGVYGHDIEGS